MHLPAGNHDMLRDCTPHIAIQRGRLPAGPWGVSREGKRPKECIKAWIKDALGFTLVLGQEQQKLILY